MQRGASRGSVVATAVAVLTVAAATAAAVWAVDRQERSALEDRLRSNLRAMVQTLGLWADDQLAGVKAVASEPRVRDAVGAVVAGRPAEVDAWVRPASTVRGYEGYFITDASGAWSPPTSRGWSDGRRTSPPTVRSPPGCGPTAQRSRDRCLRSRRASTPGACCAPAPRRSSCAPG